MATTDIVQQDRQRVEARRVALEHAIAAMQHHSSDAVDTLVKLMKNTKVAPSSRIAAAKIILETSRDWLTTEDMQTRLEALEAAHAQKL